MVRSQQPAGSIDCCESWLRRREASRSWPFVHFRPDRSVLGIDSTWPGAFKHKGLLALDEQRGGRFTQGQAGVRWRPTEFLRRSMRRLSLQRIRSFSACRLRFHRRYNGIERLVRDDIQALYVDLPSLHKSFPLNPNRTWFTLTAMIS